MTVETAERLVIYQGNSAATNFPYNFVIPAADTAAVSIQDFATGTLLETLAVGTFTLNGVGDVNGGSVDYPIDGSAPLDATKQLVIIRTVPFLQETSISNQGGFLPRILEQQLDLLEMQIQQIAEEQSRSLTVNPGQDVPDLTEIAAAEYWAAQAELSADQAAQYAALALGNWTPVTIVGDGVTTDWPLGIDPGSVNNIFITLAGIDQIPGTSFDLVYPASVPTIRFSSPPPNGVSGLGRFGSAIAVGVPNDGSITTVKLATEAVTGDKIAPETIIQTVLTRAAMKALDTTKATASYLKEAGREGVFKWTLGDFSAQITADTAEGLYIKATAIASNIGAWVRTYVGAAELRWFGALGDGATNDTTAIAAAFASGVVLSGNKRVYVVSGDMSVPGGINLSDAEFQQLTPNSTTRKTLFANGVSNVTLKRVKVNRNGNGLGGALGTAAGIWITGGTGHYLEDCEVYGSDMGNGIVLTGASHFNIVRPKIHDIIYVAAVLPPDDQVQGLWLSACTDFSILEPKIYTIRGIVGGSPRRAFGRPLALGLGCSYFRIIGGEIYDADVGIDLSGSAGNVNFALVGVTVRDVETWGIKLANYNRYGTVMGCNVHRAGSAGFVGSGPTVDVDLPDSPVPASLPQHVTFIGCGAWDTGNGNTGRGTSQPAGFLVIPGAAPSYQDYPRGYRFIGCTAYDNQTVKTQYHGFRCETSFGGQPMNEVVNCKSGGYAVGGQHVATFPYPATRVYGNAAISIPNNASTAVAFNAEDFDGASMHSLVSNTDTVFCQEPGWYRVEGQATFTGNGTGLRSAIVSLGGVNLTRIADSQPGSGVNDTTVRVSGLAYVSDITGGFKLSLFQNSGGALNASNVQLAVTKAMPNN